MLDFNNFKAVAFFINSNKIKFNTCTAEADKFKIFRKRKFNNCQCITVRQNDFRAVQSEFCISVGYSFISDSNNRIFKTLYRQTIRHLIPCFATERFQSEIMNMSIITSVAQAVSEIKFLALEHSSEHTVGCFIFPRSDFCIRIFRIIICLDKFVIFIFSLDVVFL